MRERQFQNHLAHRLVGDMAEIEQIRPFWIKQLPIIGRDGNWDYCLLFSLCRRTLCSRIALRVPITQEGEKCA